ncbi:YeeE/YedE thiosulfate transporter family protein [Olleya sp. YS]|uniref:YeeE/YedE family protein n=1 Tax=Olleya sp. YS TaxID=3028318 RepID=UPI0024345456|nr:YeeE/YedE thiosulfate transporter family protein [Olleya sp. YS]WGD34277.1 YeeE/YedE thiosulfate transporter family protein [Olleya sp. YS]
MINPLPWFIAGPLIAVIMFVLLRLGKTFGMSSNLRTICSISGAGRFSSFFSINWRDNIWSLVVLIGVIFGGVFAFQVLEVAPPQIHENVVDQLNAYGFDSVNSSYLPTELFGINQLLSVKGFAIILIAGFLVGFGARYAGGCTSGHAIMGLSNLQRPSLIAVIGFFIGGLVMVHLIFPLIF